MSSPISLRKATIDDLQILFTWRNDPATRRISHNTAELDLDSHGEWLRATLDDANRSLYIAEENGVPVGTVRADRVGDVHVLSWTVAPETRGRGIGKRMVHLLANEIKSPIRAEIKAGNMPSVRIAEYAGMTLESEKDGILYFRRGALKY